MDTPRYQIEKSEGRIQRIAALNDILRTTFIPAFGRVVMTSGVNALGDAGVSETVEAVQKFSTFTKDNDPHGEHDLGRVVLGDGTKVFWKIDYFDKAMVFGSENPADPSITQRVLTIMLAEEY